MAKMMFVGAHPDDETFMAGATLARYASEGHEIKIVCATKGEAGQWSDVIPVEGKLGEFRESEHRRGLNTLGINQLEYLGFQDGTLANQNVQELTDKVAKIAKDFKPDILLTSDLNGISGHIDHIVMAVVATYVFQRVDSIKKLYHIVLLQDEKQLYKRNYWGREENEITTFIDVKEWIGKKIEAAMCHETQRRDTERLIPFWQAQKTDLFVLAGSRVETKLPENDLFCSITK